jgi:plastocyanin
MRPHSLRSLLLGGALVAVLATACGSAQGATAPAATDPSAQQVTITVGNAMSFDPAGLTVRAGQPVTVTLRNTGLMPHDFTLADGVAEPVTITANAGQTSAGTFTLERPGTYAFECSMPGHAQAGMRGTITAQ